MPDLAQIALDQFAQRRRYQQQRRAAGQITAEEADARLFPWLAIALRCGAPADALHPHLPAMIASRVSIHDGGSCTESWARCHLADDFCQLADALAVLAKARDAALRADETNPNTRALVQLARAFPTCPPFAPAQGQPERKAA